MVFLWNGKYKSEMDNLVAAWNRLSLSEQEGEVFNFDNQKCKTECTFTAKFFTKRSFNIDAVVQTLKPYGGRNMTLRFNIWVIILCYLFLRMN